MARFLKILPNDFDRTSSFKCDVLGFCLYFPLVTAIT